MAGLLIVPGIWPVIDVNGDPVSGATINFYSPGTTTPKAVYSDSTLSTSLGAVLTTNAGGEPTTLAGAVARLWWAPNGQAYDIQVVAGGSTRLWEDVIISEPSFVNTFSASYWGASPSASAATNRNALQGAIDYVSSLGGGTIDIDIPGYYSIAKRTSAPTDRALNVPRGVQIRGFGTGAPTDASVALVTLQPSEDMTLFIAGDTMVTQTCTISNASPGVITAPSHGKVAGDVVYFATSDTLPAPLIPMFPYYVLASGLTGNTFQVGLIGSTPAINTTTAGSGTHTLISASSLTHSFGMSAINIYGGSVANVQCLIAESTVGAEWDNVLVQPGNPALQRHGWLHAANFLAAWLNQYTRLEVGGFTSGVGAAHFGSDCSYSQCTFSGCGVNFRMSEGSITVDGGQIENGNNGGGIGTGRGIEIVPSGTGRNVATAIRSRFVANNIDVYIYDSPIGGGWNGRVLIDSVHHDCRTTNISVGVNFNNLSIDGTFNEMGPAGSPHITWRGASTGNVIQGNFSEGVATRFSGLPADALVLSGGNGQLNRVDGYAAVPIVDITALRAAVWNAGRPTLVQVISNWTTGDGGGFFRWNGASTVTDDSGVTIKEAATLTGRWERQIPDSQCWPEWFGPISDNSGNATTAVQAAINYGIASGNEIRLGEKTYICDTLIYLSSSFALMPSIRGASMVRTTIKRLSTGADGRSVLQISNNAATNFVANMSIADLTIDGLTTTKSSVGIEFAGPVRLSITKVKTTNCYHGHYVNGGVGTRFNECYMTANAFGITFANYAGTVGVNWPNFHHLNFCIITDNTDAGVFFDGGRALTLRGCDIENNGTVAASATGGLIVGTNVDIEDAGANPIGVKVYDCWFEQNKGIGSISFKSGRNAVMGGNIAANPSSTYDIHISGGSYILTDVEINSAKASAIFEDTGTTNGNVITRVTGITLAQTNVNRAKTKLDQLGRVGTLANLASPIRGERATITDSTTTATGNFYATITGGGGNTVPATYDGTNWRIG